MSGQIVTLKTHQLPVTRLPRLLTELPFFYLTKKAKALTQPIDFRTEDNSGRPILWKVNPNFGERIGPPSLMAHEVWVRLIKPRIDRERKAHGFIPSLIPLGGVRECLRQLGWSYGGHQAHSLIKAINQIGGAWCEANLWMPTRETNEQGGCIFRAFHANFSRLSLYAIGTNHLTEEDIRNGRIDFTFELDDILYIKLDPVELRMLEAETDRPVDNEYLFSLSPAARRWYELMAPKFFGVISNSERGRGFCEIRYSWYVKRHHTLKPHQTRKRMVQQMTEVIGEHLHFGFIQKVEYQSIREERDGNAAEEIVIRYYPGKFAVKLTRRIADSLRPSELKKKARDHRLTENLQDSQQGDRTLVEGLTSLGVAASKARDIVAKNRLEVQQQLRALPLRERTGIRDVAAWIVTAIEEKFELPPALTRALEKEALRKESCKRGESERNRDAHENRFRPEYSRYIASSAENIRRNSPTDYQDFLEATREERSMNDRFLEPAELRQILFEKLFADFFQHHPTHPLLSFWDWDATTNPDSFRRLEGEPSI